MVHITDKIYFSSECSGTLSLTVAIVKLLPETIPRTS